MLGPTVYDWILIVLVGMLMRWVAILTNAVKDLHSSSKDNLAKEEKGE